MRRLVLLILALATLLPSLAQAYDILVLQSRHDGGCEDVMNGFRSKSSVLRRLIVLSDFSEVDVVRIVREDRPQLIVAIGDAALTAARKVQQTPVIAVMALGVHNLKTKQQNLTGIGMFAPPEHYIGIFRSLKAERVGIIHNPAKSGWYLQRARQAAAAAGIELVVREVKEPKDTLNQLSSMAGKIDALWMLPDSTAVTRETAEAYFHFGQQQTVPVVSFAAGYLGLGAAAVVEINRIELGRQAGDMAEAIMNGNRVEGMPLGFPSGMKLKTNPTVLKNLGTLLTEHNFPLH